MDNSIKYRDDMTLDEYKEYYYQSKHWKGSEPSKIKLRHVMRRLFVLQHRFTKEEKMMWKAESRVNPLNPLTYISVGVLTIVIIVYTFFKAGAQAWEAIVEELPKTFKWQRV